MNVSCITIEGENAIIAADRFDWLYAQAAKVEKMEKVVAAARKVIAWDWSDNDADCLADMRLLLAAVDAL